MIVLWITGSEPYTIGKHFDRPNNGGGWLEYSHLLLADRDNVELSVLSCGHTYDNVRIDRVSYSGFEPTDAHDRIEQKIRELKPDIVHIWGTELEHFEITMGIICNLGLEERTVVSIQGLTSVISRYHYFGYLPYDVIGRKTLYERLRHNDTVSRCEAMKKRGESEERGLRMAGHCIGRTDWDHACVKQINPGIKYHKCNEILRKEFYASEWNLTSCERHAVVFSSFRSILKGFNNMIEALRIVRQVYPDVILYVSDISPMQKKLGRNSFKRYYCLDYLCETIEKNKLEGQIKFVGNLDSSQMVRHYLRGNVFVCASSIENSSNSVGEAMLLGMPVVASDVGGMKTLISHNYNGMLYQGDAPYMLADCIIRLFEDEAFACSIAENAHKSAAKVYDPVKNTDDLCSVYLEMMNEHKDCT